MPGNRAGQSVRFKGFNTLMHEVQAGRDTYVPVTPVCGWIRHFNGTVMQTNKTLLRSPSVKSAPFWGSLLKRMLLKRFHWGRSHGRFWSGGFSYCCVQKRAHYISFSSFQMPPMLFSFFRSFFVKAHFRCSTWIGVMAHSHLLFSRLLFSSMRNVSSGVNPCGYGLSANQYLFPYK